LHLKKPSKEVEENWLEYHVVPGFVPAGAVLHHHTLPTLFTSKYEITQPIRVGFGVADHGISFNFIAHPVFLDIFTSNGVVHALDSVLFLPAKVGDIVDAVPTLFSTFRQAVDKTGLDEEYHDANETLTLLAPTNAAWHKIPGGVLAFLFSDRGAPILKKLLKYHIVPNDVFYSDSLLKEEQVQGVEEDTSALPKKKFYHAELDTLLGPPIHVDVITFLRFTDIKLNGKSLIRVSDIIAQDGVIHGLSGILIPPKKGTKDEPLFESWDMATEDMLVEWAA